MKDSEEKSGLKMMRSSSANDMSQSISMFKKYLLRPRNNNVGRTNTEESSHVITTCPSHIHAASSSSSPLPLPSPKSCNPTLNRPPSLLEQRLLPQMRCNGELPSFRPEDRCSTAQLTIFYDGAINVYDNVPIDKAQAIMLLAGESSSSNTTESPEMNTDHHFNATQRSKLRTGLPLARRQSLQCFLQKRRHRKLVNQKSPYARGNPSSRNNGEEIITESKNEEKLYGYDQNHEVSLSPFPSRLGFSVPISVNKASC